MRLRHLLLGLSFCLASARVSGFELTTHGLLTLEAYRKSILMTDAALPSRLGIDLFLLRSQEDKSPFGNTYVEMSISGDRPWVANRPPRSRVRYWMQRARSPFQEYS